jgi:hypothetical protein
MSIKKDWVHGPDDEFDALFKKYCQTVVANTSGADPVWPHIPAVRVTERGFPGPFFWAGGSRGLPCAADWPRIGQTPARQSRP